MIYKTTLCYCSSVFSIYYLNFKVFFLLSTRFTNNVRYAIFSTYDFKVEVKDFRHPHNVISFNFYTLSTMIQNVYQHILRINTSVILDSNKFCMVINGNNALISVQLYREISKSHSTSLRVNY